MRAEWKRETKQYVKAVIKSMENSKFLMETDLVQMDMLGDAYELYIDAMATLRKEGITTVARNGDIKPHPASAIMNKAANLILQIEKELGVSAKSRKMLQARISDTEEEKSALTVFMESLGEEENEGKGNSN